MEEGRVSGEMITCPWHGSGFSLLDGSVRRGPSTAPLPVYECRVSQGSVEVRDRGE